MAFLTLIRRLTSWHTAGLVLQIGSMSKFFVAFREALGRLQKKRLLLSEVPGMPLKFFKASGDSCVKTNLHAFLLAMQGA